MKIEQIKEAQPAKYDELSECEKKVVSPLTWSRFSTINSKLKECLDSTSEDGSLSGDIKQHVSINATDFNKEERTVFHKLVK